MENVCFVRLHLYAKMLGTFGQKSIWLTRNYSFFGQSKV